MENKKTEQKEAVMKALADAWPLLSDEERGRLKGYGEAVAELREAYEKKLKEMKTPKEGDAA